MFKELRPLMEASLFSTEIDKKVNDIVIEKMLNDWLPTQALVDKTMAGEDVYDTLTTDTGKPINYGLCITSELSELLDSIPWKHWKDIDAKPDFDNIKTEIVDLMHFLPSVLNTIANTLDRQASLILYDKNDIEEEILAKDIHQEEWNRINVDGISFYGQARTDHWFDDSKDQDSIYDLISDYHSAGSIGNSHIIMFYKEKDINGFLDVSDMDKIYLIGHIAYILVLHTLKLYSLIFKVSVEDAIEELWSIYLVKNTLNVFRVKNGYKEGRYVKVWNGREDNVVVNEIAKTITAGNKPLNKDLLYSKVEDYYNTISNG